MTVTDQSPYGPTWYAATMVGAPERGPLTRDIDVDVSVIGAGLAGLTVAREVARRGWSVAVLEAGRVAALASGRNGGFVSPGFAERIETIIERVGLPRAKELWTLSEGGVDYIRRTIRESNMAGVGARDGRLSVRRTDDEAGSIEHVAMLRVEFGADVEAWPTEQVREVLRSRAYFQAVHFANAFHMHPLNYALGLAALAEAAGVRVYEQTAATGIDPAGVRKRIQTPQGRVRAHHAVLAASLGAGGVDGPIGATVVPVSTYVAVTKPLGETLFDAIRYTGAVADTRRAGDYYRVVADDRLMWGGRFTTRAASPRRLKALMRRDITRTYPQLGEAEIEYAWTGTMAYAVHKMPQIGELAPGYWLAGAFGGHGLNTSAMAGEMIARAILDGDDRWRLFSPYELVWAGGRSGRVAAQGIAWSMQARDAIAERIARYRDHARARAAEQQAQWMAEQAARRAEREARRAENERKRAAAEEARKLQDEARKAELAARKAVEQARRAEQAETARRVRERIEAARRAKEDAARQAEQAVPVAPEPVAPEPAVPEPVAPEPVVVKPVVPEPAAPEPIVPEVVTPEPVMPETVASEPDAAMPVVEPETVHTEASAEPVPEPPTAEPIPAAPEKPEEPATEAAAPAWSGPAARALAWSNHARAALAQRIARYREEAQRSGAERQARFAAEAAARRAEREARRAEEDAKRAAEEAARQAEIERRKTELAARRARPVAEPAAAEPVAPESAAAEPVAPESAAAEPAASESAAAEPAVEPTAVQSVVPPEPSAETGAVEPIAAESEPAASAVEIALPMPQAADLADAPVVVDVPVVKKTRKPRAKRRSKKNASSAPPP